jgi:hypothetical protein
MTNKRIICRWLSVAILLASFCISASATVMEYTTQGSFTTATSGISTIDFNGTVGEPALGSYSNSTGYQYDGVTFIGYDNASGPSGYSLNDTDLSPDWNSGADLDGPGSFGSSANAGINVTLPANTFAVGTNFMASGHDGNGQPDSEAVTFQVVLSTGPTVYTITSLAGFSSMAFVGFTSSTAITSITFDPQSASDRTELDNFQFGQTASESSPTPEAGTSLLCGSGLLLIVRFLRRRRSLPPVA